MEAQVVTVTRAQVRQIVLAHGDEEVLLADGFESAFVGVASRAGQPLLAAYSYHRAVKVLMERDGMTYEDAVEWMEFNVVGAWAGERTPLWLHEPVDGDEPEPEEQEQPT
jgi:hypothetical protein